MLAGGCFWGMQELIRNMPGVQSTRAGYSGGDVPNVPDVVSQHTSGKCMAARRHARAAAGAGA